MSSSPSSQRSAVVTGAAQGIGAAVAARLAQDGLSVLLADLPGKQAALDALSKQIVAAGGRAATFAGDVSVEEDVKRMVSHAVGELGPLAVVRESVSALGRC
jgi:NAD(P)-dependent dehydrogenase (short-subunit alcohol dehydrogenase family)